MRVRSLRRLVIHIGQSAGFGIGFVAFICVEAITGTAFGQSAVEYRINGQIQSECDISVDCGSGNRCLSLDLANISSRQDTAEITLSCNGDGTYVVAVTSSNGGRLMNQSEGIGYSASFTGEGRQNGQISTGMLVEFALQGGAPAQRTMQIRLTESNSRLGSYRDVITATLTPF